MLDFHIFNFLCKKYSDLSPTVLKYLKNTKANINNVLVMTEDFNIRDNSWSSLFPHHSSHYNILTDIVNSFNLCISKSTKFLLCI